MSSEREFRPGCIVRLRMEDFMHYHDQTVQPAPGFNVVIGHNGSGKSAIVNAICIGLGGDIETLQRCERLENFVRRGAREAVISLELHNSQGDNWHVSCRLSNRGRLGWTLGGKKANKAEVEQLVTSLNIQTGNMCQFLPQDVVKNFPLMSAQERFLNTVRAVGEGRLVDQFDKLKDIQETINTNTSLIQTKENTLKDLRTRIEAISHKKSKLEEVEKMIDAKHLAEKKLKWLVFENDIKEAKKTKKKCEELNEKKKAVEGAISKCQNVDKEKETELSKLSEEMSEPEAFLRDYEQQMIAPEISVKLSELEHIEQLMSSEIEDNSDRVKTEEKTKAEISKLSRELKHCTSESVLEVELNKLKEREVEKYDRSQSLSSSKTESNYRLKSLSQSVKTTRQTLKSLESAETQKLAQLKRSNSDCHDAVIYLRNNLPQWRKSGRFMAGIHEPAVLCLTVKDLNNAVYIEKETGSLQLEAFVCEDAGEADELSRELRKHFKKVSVVHGDLEKLRQFEGPHGARFKMRASAKELEPFNFVNYVADMFEAPPAVKAHLYMHTAVFNTAVFSQENNETDNISSRFPGLRKYYVGKILNTIRVSKYSKEISRGEENIGHFTAQKLKINFDQEEIANLRKKLEDMQSDISLTEKAIQKTKDAEVKMKEELAQIKRDIEENNQARQNKNNLEISLKHKKEFLEQLSQPSNLSAHTEKIAQYREDKKQKTRDLVQATADAQELTAKASEQYVRKYILQLRQNHLLAKYSFNTTELTRLQGELTEVKGLVASEERSLDQWKDKLRRSKDEAQTCTSDEAGAGVAEKVSKKPPPNYAAAFQTIEAATVEDLKAHIESLEKDIKAEDRVIAEQVKINKMFAEKRESIEATEGELEQLRREVTEATEESEKISTVGVQKLQELIERVNDRFSSYFANLGYVGQVTLYRKQEDDYKSYGVSIKVKFRDETDLAELSRGRQSGGEMSVTTAVYMLALQEMTTVPFRCVDEINQGLDERNERRVWDMILSAATEGQGSQYFYLAPKMPYNLDYRPGTVVHVCHASDSIEQSFTSTNWVQAARKLRSDRN